MNRYIPIDRALFRARITRARLVDTTRADVDTYDVGPFPFASAAADALAEARASQETSTCAITGRVERV